MKLKVAFLVMLFQMSCMTFASVNSGNNDVQVKFRIVRPSKPGKLTPRIPSCSVVACWFEDRIVFSASLAGNVFSIINNENVVCYAIIDEDGIVELPDELSGECELRVYVGDAVYTTTIFI